jgi:methyl-accepting chemotaxis protein
VISPVRDENGEVTHFVGLQNDISHLRQIFSQVQVAATAVTQTTHGNKAALETLSADASIQVEEIAAALNSIGAIADFIQGVARSAHQAQLNVQQAHQTLQAGNEAMQQTALSMSGIQQTLIEMAEKVKFLGDFSQKIAEVVNPINNFASETSVLAMNMAIEAGQAGEDQKSREFMVVAEAVRSLAQKSATMTAEIEQLIAQIQGATDEVFTAMNTETEQLVAGTQIVEETQQKLSQILAMNAETSALVEEIAQAAATQAQTSDNLNHTLQEVVSIADRTSKQSVLVADSFANLLEIAQSLQTSAAEFESD